MAALVLGLILGVPAGVLAAVWRNRIPDYVMRLLSLIGLSAPAFVAAIVLMMVFAIQPALVSGDQRRRRCRPWPSTCATWRCRPCRWR